jgi:hypothetical protein
MRFLKPALASLALVALATPVLAQTPGAQTPLALPAPSPGASVTQTIGTTDFSLKYSRPGVKGRTIWGALVPWDQPWRTGANEATTLVCSGDVTVEGQALPAGTYAIVAVPGKEQWTVAFSRQKNLWRGTTYDPKEDQLRVTVKPKAAEHVEWLQFTFDVVSPTETELALRWEKLRVPVKIAVDVNAKVLKDCRAAVAAAPADDWRTPYRAANWCFDNGQAPDEAAAWGAKALQMKENFQTLSLAAKQSAKAGRTKEAVDQMTKAIALGKADKDLVPAQIEPMEKLLAEWTAKK